MAIEHPGRGRRPKWSGPVRKGSPQYRVREWSKSHNGWPLEVRKADGNGSGSPWTLAAVLDVFALSRLAQDTRAALRAVPDTFDPSAKLGQLKIPAAKAAKARRR